MDFDRVGQENAQRFAKKLGQGRVRIVPPPQPRSDDGELDLMKGVKDPCDCLRRGLNLRDFLDQAKCLPHDQILSFSELRNVLHLTVIHSRTFITIYFIPLSSKAPSLHPSLC